MDESGALFQDAYKYHSEGILDIPADMKDEAVAERPDLREAETNTEQILNKLKVSPEE